MMIFSELYGAYYHAVADVLRAACHHPLTKGELRELIAQRAFGESVLNLEPALTEGRWPLLLPDGTTILRHAPTMPLTTLQKRWLNAIALDLRIRLFTEDPPTFPDVAPLFRPADIQVYDKYGDGDPYADETYIRHFRLILQALRENLPLTIDSLNRRGRAVRCTMIPTHLEYSEKDDKFRLFGTGTRHGGIINLGRVVSIRLNVRSLSHRNRHLLQPRKCTVVMEVWDHRNGLERVLMHFAHFEKQAEQLGDRHYRVTVTYHEADATEMLIRILSFGPVVKVVGPDDMVTQIKNRLMMQKNLMQKNAACCEQ